MAEQSSSSSGGTSGIEPLAVPGLPPDWHLSATEKIVSTVDTVRVKSAGPAIGIARAAVFGLLGALLAIVAAIIFLIGLVRFLNVVIPQGVWLVYLILGAIFCAAGMFVWSKRPRKAAS